MTICVGVLAAGGRSIVCVADKAATYGDEIQWDANETKIVPLEKASGVVALIAGSDAYIGPVLRGLNTVGFGNDLQRLLDISGRVYSEMVEKVVTASFLTPRLLKRSEYIRAISGPQINPYFEELADDIAELEVECDMLLCGFDKHREAFLVDIGDGELPTDVTHDGFAAVGCGYDKAISRLLLSEWKLSYPVERVLFDAFDAKANAEIAVGVGHEWDAIILTSDHKRHEVPKDIKDLIESAWAKWTHSPFHVKEKNELGPPPKDWKEQLRRYVESIMPSAAQKSKERR